MSNVIFKRGPQQRLPVTAEDGVFYLTEDTNRLYVGIGTTRHLLNQTVNIVASLSVLESTSNNWSAQEKQDHVNDFYYLTAENILAVWKEKDNQYQWVQINPDTDTYLHSVAVASSVDTNVGTVTSTFKDQDNNTLTTASFAIAGAGGITVSATGTNGLVLTGKEYSLSRSITNNNAVITLDGATANNAISLQPGDNISFSSTGTAGIVINAVDTYVNSANLSMTGNGAIALTLKDADNNTLANDVLDNIGIVLHDNTFVTLGDTSSLSGASKGIYSAAEIDTLLNGLNGMTYKGTLGEGGTVTALPLSNVANGDTYVVVHPIYPNDLGPTSSQIIGTVPSSGTIVGDMFIASGNETNGVITSNLQWTYIPSGNDSLDAVTYTTQVTPENNLMILKNVDRDTIASIQFSAGSGIVLSSTTAAAGMVTNIAHDTYATTTSTTTASSSESFTAITGLTLTNGHVTGITSEVFEPLGYKFGTQVAQSVVASSVVDGTRMNSTSNSGANDVTVNINLSDTDNNPISSQSLKLNSSSIKLAKGNNGEVIMNMEWGTF